LPLQSLHPAISYTFQLVYVFHKISFQNDYNISHSISILGTPDISNHESKEKDAAIWMGEPSTTGGSSIKQIEKKESTK